MTYLKFATQKDCYIGNCIIADKMRLTGECTCTYSTPTEFEGGYIIPKPESRYIDATETQQALGEFVQYEEIDTPTEG